MQFIFTFCNYNVTDACNIFFKKSNFMLIDTSFVITVSLGK